MQRMIDAATRSPSKLSHIVLKTSQYKKMVDWYVTVLGARISHGNDRLSFLTYDDEHHRLAIVRMEGLEPRPRYAAGLDHVSFTYADLGVLLATYLRLKAAGIEPQWPVNHGITTSFYYKDPDGNKVELQFENFPTESEVMAYMEGPVFAANPLGSSFVPEDLVRRYQAGEPIYDLVHTNQDPSGPEPIKILEEMDLFRI